MRTARARRGAATAPHSPPRTSRSCLPGLKYGTTFGGTCTRAPVRGLRPCARLALAGAERTEAAQLDLLAAADRLDDAVQHDAEHLARPPAASAQPGRPEYLHDVGLGHRSLSSSATQTPALSPVELSSGVSASLPPAPLRPPSAAASSSTCSGTRLQGDLLGLELGLDGPRRRPAPAAGCPAATGRCASRSSRSRIRRVRTRCPRSNVADERLGAAPLDLRDVAQPLDARGQLDEQPEVGDVGDEAVDLVADLVGGRELVPLVRQQLLDGERDALVRRCPSR